MEKYTSIDGRQIIVVESSVPGMAGEPSYYLSATIDGQKITIAQAIQLLPSVFAQEVQQWASDLAECNYANAVAYCM